MHPKISIIMPVRDTAHFLNDCIDSIRAQDYPQWELAAVDDRSSDDSRQILEQYAGQDPRIAVLPNKGTGIIDALNTGYVASSGAYITRMDSDDIMPRHKLGTMLRQLESFGKGAVSTGLVQYFSESQLGQGYIAYQEWLNRLSRQGSNFTELYKECPVPSPCWMASREDFERAGAFRSDLYPEDYDLCFRFYASGLHVLPAAEVLHLWRDHSQRSSRTHAHYADNSFIRIKMYYFLRLHYDARKRLVLWGAGDKAKNIAKYLISENICFDWRCNNPNKIGREIYGVTMQNSEDLILDQSMQLILTMANKDEQSTVAAKLQRAKLTVMENIFWMC